MPSRFTVLYVDDDDQVREALGRVLDRAGFRVIVAPDANAALRILRTDHVDLLLTDVVMDGLNGFQLAVQAKQLRPHLRILYVTGYDEHASSGDRQFGKILRKPIRAADLVQEICTALGG